LFSINQKNGNIPQTGVFDTATKELLKKPRCGVPDEDPGDFAKRKKRFVTYLKWDKTNLSWR
jgi:hypothetical protein